MKALILAGGKGSRLASMGFSIPKPLVAVKGEPFVSILIRFLAFHKISEIVISTHHLAEEFQGRLPSLLQLFPSISLQRESELLGTGGAVRLFCQNLPPEEQFLVLNGDTFFDFDLGYFQEKFRKQTALALKQVPDSSRFGTVEFENGRIKKFCEKDPQSQGGLIYAGYSLLIAGDVLRLLQSGTSSLEKDFFPSFLQGRNTLYGEVFEGNFIDIGIPEDLRMANEAFDFSKFGNQ